jgi:hypothetical protein
MEDIIHQAFLDELEKISKVGVGVFTPGAQRQKRIPTAKSFKTTVKAPKLAVQPSPLAEAPKVTPVPGPAYEGL